MSKFLAGVFIGTLLLFRSICWAGSELRAGEREARIARHLAELLPSCHLSRAPLDDTISERAWTNFISELDYEHVYFLESDIAEFEKEKRSLDDSLKDGDVDFAYRVFERFRQRAAEGYDCAVRCLDTDLDLDGGETYRWKRSKAPWPRDESERDEIWSKKIKNDYLALVLRDELAAESGGGSNPREEEGGGARRLAPRETIDKRYRQFVGMLDDADSEWVFQKYLTAFAEAYDPHTSYMSPSILEDFDIEMKLSLVGIGAILGPEDGAAKILKIIPGGPAARDKREKRLAPGDRIIAVAQGDGESVDVLHWPLHRMVGLIRGKKGTKVVLTVIPASDPLGATTKQVDLIRDEVKLEEEAARLDLKEVSGEGEPGKLLGVVTLPSFYGDIAGVSIRRAGRRSCANDVAKLIEEGKEKGAEGFILDLRGNGGGSLEEAVRVAGLFITSGPVVQVLERDWLWGGTRLKPLYDPDGGIVYAGPVVVLVNRFSASASEIVAAALQDYGRAVIVGDSKTHGKGTVQAILGLGRDRDMGSAKITTSKYYRVTGMSTQIKGVASDIVVPSAADSAEFGEEYLANPLPWSVTNAAVFAAAADISAIVGALRERSGERRAENPRFVAYARQLAQFGMMQLQEETPLNIAERREMAKGEQRLAEVMEKTGLAREQGVAGATKEGADLVLEEGLNVLSDLVVLGRQMQPEAFTVKELPRKNLLNVIVDWFRF